MVVERIQACGCVDKSKEEDEERDWMVVYCVERRQGCGFVDESKGD